MISLWSVAPGGHVNIKAFLHSHCLAWCRPRFLCGVLLLEGVSTSRHFFTVTVYPGVGHSFSMECSIWPQHRYWNHTYQLLMHSLNIQRLWSSCLRIWQFIGWISNHSPIHKHEWTITSLNSSGHGQLGQLPILVIQTPSIAVSKAPWFSTNISSGQESNLTNNYWANSQGRIRFFKQLLRDHGLL